MGSAGLKRYARLALFLGLAASVQFCFLNPQPEPPAGGSGRPQPEPPGGTGPGGGGAGGATGGGATGGAAGTFPPINPGNDGGIITVPDGAAADAGHTIDAASADAPTDGPTDGNDESDGLDSAEDSNEDADDAAADGGREDAADDRIPDDAVIDAPDANDAPEGAAQP